MRKVVVDMSNETPKREQSKEGTGYLDSQRDQTAKWVGSNGIWLTVLFALLVLGGVPALFGVRIFIPLVQVALFAGLGYVIYRRIVR